ncbi:hypothetical protein Vretimale_17674 [Volvox reticuliferus]|uniref:Peptidase M43 pregnancy-associated plasma-A domain-containing protein n=1 Tax=Volvox reticuliferus TaxID=1737510 RepID=A0A8J4GWW4_9CHLO|nr:hypothetical protein Vretimale_17674 [Volvox reticuliferus]
MGIVSFNGQKRAGPLPPTSQPYPTLPYYPTYLTIPATSFPPTPHNSIVPAAVAVGVEEPSTGRYTTPPPLGYPVPPPRLRRPDRATYQSDAESLSSYDAQLLIDQASTVSSIAYLLFSAATPLSEVEGSSRALLPYLRPNVLRAFISQAGLCSSALADQLYDISLSLYGTARLKACHYDLFLALNSTFTWVRYNIPLSPQHIPGQPNATVLWLDASAISDTNFAAAVLNALLTGQGGLTVAATTVSEQCGLGVSEFAALVPRIASVLKQLHGHLQDLQHLAKARLHGSPKMPQKSKSSTYNSGDGGPSASGRRRAASQQAVTSSTESSDMRKRLDSRKNGDDNGDGSLHLRRALLAVPQANSFYNAPPAGFIAQPPAAMPKVLIGLVFHVMLYKDGNGTGPYKYKMAPSYVERMVQVVNYMSKPTNIEFFVKEVRNNATMYPYLLLKDRKAWLQIGNADCSGPKLDCFITSDFVPRSDTLPSQGFVYISWDQVSAHGANSDTLYNDGPNTLLHELFHHLGLLHPFDKPMDESSSSYASSGICIDGDEVKDTPTTKGPIVDSSFIFPRATAYCLELFWGQYGGDWTATYDRWSSTLGIPDQDINAWADSCPKSPGYDELGNYMTYNTPVCFAALGHFTKEQAQRAHYMTAELNPVMYGWGQYYASRQASAPATYPAMLPQGPPEPVTFISKDSSGCTTTSNGACTCMAVWQLGSRMYTYCARTDSADVVLRCQVANPDACPECAALPPGQQCILPCAGDPRLCKASSAPIGAALSGAVSRPPQPRPPRPRPPSPPPRPPPPPPLALPLNCTKSIRNCTCRSRWVYNGKLGAYCSSYSGAVLMCLVTPSCPTFWSAPIQACNPALRADNCSISSSRLIPDTPAQEKPPGLPPSIPQQPDDANVTQEASQNPLPPAMLTKVEALPPPQNRNNSPIISEGSQPQQQMMPVSPNAEQPLAVPQQPRQRPSGRPRRPGFPSPPLGLRRS